MINECKFKVDITYNSDFFSEGEIRETIRAAIRDLNDAKEKRFGRVMRDPGKTNKGVSCSVTQCTEPEVSDSIDLVDTLVSLSSQLDNDELSDVPQLSDHKLEELMVEVRTAFKK